MRLCGRRFVGLGIATALGACVRGGEPDAIGSDATGASSGTSTGDDIVDGGSTHGSTDTGDTDQPADPGDLPLLDPGNHVGVLVGFNPTMPPETAAQVDARWSEAVAAGMRIGRVQIDWADLEPSAGVYDLSQLDESLSLLSQDGVRPFLLLDSVDSEIPADLRARIDTGELRFDDPEMIDRHAALLERVVPSLVEHGGWVIAVANEVGNILDDLPTAEREQRTGELVAFFTAARAKVHELEPELAVTVTIREQEPENELPFLDAVDVVSFNFYCSRLVETLAVEDDSARVVGYIDAMMAIAGDRAVVLHELGCHGGWEDQPTTTQASLEQQRLFYELVFAEIAVRPRLRAAVVFQLVDWDPELVQTHYIEPFMQAGLPQEFIDAFTEALETAGLLRFADGSARPAWTTFVDAL